MSTTTVQNMMKASVEDKKEFIVLLEEVPKAIIQKSTSVAPDVLDMIKTGKHTLLIAEYVFTKLNSAKNDRTTANVDIEGDDVTSSAPLPDDNLNFVGVFVDVPTATMTLEDTLNTVRFRYQVPDGDAPAAAAAAPSNTPSAVGSSSSAIDLAVSVKKRKQAMIATDVPSDASSVRSDTSVPTTTHPSVVGSPVVGGKAKATDLEILGSPTLKATLDAALSNKHTRVSVSDSHVVQCCNEFVKTLSKFTRPQLQQVAEGMEVNKNQKKAELANDIAEETCQLAVNKLNNGRV